MLAAAPVFLVEGEPYFWRDVILSAVQCGHWQELERRARRASATVRHAEITGQHLPEGTLDKAARDFRYAHDLVTAQSMEDWLRAHDLSIQEWSAYIRREQMLAREGSAADDLVARYPLPDDVAARLTVIDAICSGSFDTWGCALAQRAAAHASVVASGLPIAAIGASSAGDLVAIVPPALRALLGDDESTLLASAERLVRLDASLAAFRDSLLTERAVADFVSARQLDWVRFACRLMSFPNESMAAEAALLLREDGEGFTGVYQVAHTAPRGAQFFLDQIDDAMKDHFLGSRPGDLIGPVHIDDEYVLYQVEEKVLPSLRDQDVRERAELGVLTSALDQQFAQRVVWQDAH